MDIEMNNFSGQLSNFFENWREIEQQQRKEQENLPFEQKLAQFFKDWRKVFIDERRLSHFFTAYKSDEVQEPIREAKAQGLYLNVWQTAGLKQDEVKNSQVLKWFLDWREEHGQGNKILAEFLKLLPHRFQNYSLERYSTIAECCPLGNQDNRIDIEIDAPEFLLFIEIKINAGEGKEQLQRYFDIAQTKARHKDWMIVYLTKDKKLPQQYQDSDRYIGVSWLQVSNMLNQYAKGKDDNRSAWLAKQFADHIKTF